MPIHKKVKIRIFNQGARTSEGRHLGPEEVVDIINGLSLPTELLVNECNAEVVPVDKSLRKRSIKLL